MKRSFRYLWGFFDTRQKQSGWVAHYALVVMTASFAVFSTPSSAEAVLDEVIVTAQKRTENLQEVPVAITAITAETIENYRIVTIADISNLSTSVNWQQGLTSSNSTVSIRGLGTTNFGTGVESSVGIVQDNVVLSRQNEAFGDLFNLDRIEVLRGPQGTLFGKNASAGVIHLITKAPTEEFEGKADLFYGSFDEVVARGTVSSALSDSGKVTGRLTGYYRTVDGNVRNRFDGSTLNGIDSSYGIRGKLAIEASDKLNFMIIADFSDLESNCCGEPFRTLPDNTNVFGIADPCCSVNPAVVGVDVGPSSRETSVDAPTFGNYSSSGLSVQFEYDFESVTLTSISSIREWEEETNADIDWSPLSIFQINGGSKDQDTFTQELRLNSSSDSALQYVAGVFYYDNDTTQDFNRTFFDVLVQDLDAAINTTNFAVFGDLQYSFGNGTHLGFGSRWQNEEIDYSANARRFGFNTADNPQVPTSFSDKDATFKVSITQDFGDSSMVYASFSQGYKGQALDLTTGLRESTALLFPIAPETVDSYEVGLKSEFLDNRVRLNIAAFNSEFKNFQTQAFDSDALTFRIINAGQVRTRGIEIESEFAATEALTVMFNGTFQNMEIIDLVNIGCYPGQTAAEGCAQLPNSTRSGQNVVGGTLPNAPDTKIFVAADYRGTMGSYESHANLSYTWQSDVLFELNQNPRAVQDDYGVVNVSFGIQNEDSGFDATVFVNNLFDQNYVTGIRAPGGIWGGSTGTVQQIPRQAETTYGIRLGYSF